MILRSNQLDAQPHTITTCPRCAYDLAGLSAATCPECGVDVRVEFQRRRSPKRVWPIVLIWGLCAVGWGFGAWIVWQFRAKCPPTDDPYSMAVLVAAAVSAVGLAVSVVGRRTLRSTHRVMYWSFTAAGLMLLIAVAGAWLFLTWTLGVQPK